MQLTVIGCGDAFASGGQLNTCFHLQNNDIEMLLDCGATSLLGMRRQQISTTGIDYIVLSHFHGDHYGGVPAVLLDAMIHKRTKPLTIISPPGGRERIELLTECLYQKITTKLAATFSIHYHEYSELKTIETTHFRLVAAPVIHSPESLPHAIRLEWDDKVIGFSGDTEWTDQLLPIAHQADLFICECNSYAGESPVHLSYQILQPYLPQLQARKIMLTHLGEEMLQKKHLLEVSCLEDGASYTI